MLYRDQSFNGQSVLTRENEPSLSRSPLDLAIQALRSRYKALLAWFAICIAAAMIYVAITPSEFVATATFLLEPRRPAVLTQADVNQIQQNLDTPQIESQTQVIRSARVLEKVIRDLNLARDPELSAPARGIVATIRNLLSDEVERVPTLPVEAFAERVNVRRLGQSLVLEVSVRAATPDKSARLTNAVLASYVYDQVTSKLLDMRRSGDWLQSRIEDMRSQQETALKAMQSGFAPDTAFPAADLRVLNTATPLARKAFPNTTLIMMFAISFALLTGVGGVVLLRLMDRRVWNAQDMAESLSMRFVATVPRIRKSAGFNDKQMLELARLQPLTKFAESFRTIRNELLSRGDSAPRSIGVVSCSPGEGASLVAANFANVLAASGAPTLLIDADLHSSTLTRMLASNTKVGLADVLGENATDHCDVVSLRNSLDFMPSGGVGGRASPFLFIGSPTMRNLLNDLTADHIVILDLPPLSESNDAVAVASLLDAVILVIESGKTKLDSVLLLSQSLEHAKSAIFGAVLNKTRDTEF